MARSTKSRKNGEQQGESKHKRVLRACNKNQKQDHQIYEPNNNEHIQREDDNRNMNGKSTSSITISEDDHKFPEAKELFDFLNLFLKLPDHHVLGGDILKQVVDDADKAMERRSNWYNINCLVIF
ncbi:hypothetical protein RhiirA4_482408 [Rhizophagus irregularis]|uniref:Uncharacterized protein n=1 Tax=Rhizophagus irregularis TaxID=588596 RepID=A0A2I1HL20_9GLOM|nr:hypothetical protein RhiirA4_482408 [Rhizophagus irregularis]